MRYPNISAYSKIAPSCVLGHAFLLYSHGDLHTKNVFIVGKPIIFDCIEFNKYYNYADVILDIAFMGMDLESMGRKDLSKTYTERYIELSNGFLERYKDIM